MYRDIPAEFVKMYGSKNQFYDIWCGVSEWSWTDYSGSQADDIEYRSDTDLWPVSWLQWIWSHRIGLLGPIEQGGTEGLQGPLQNAAHTLSVGFHDELEDLVEPWEAR